MSRMSSLNLILKTFATILDRSCAFKLLLSRVHFISGQFGLQVNVMNRSGNPNLLEMAILSKYNWSMYLLLPINIEGKTTHFPCFVLCCNDPASFSCCKLLYFPTLNLDWFFLN
ncbi:unnamed protein product [Vicia faba]|uniref:Uncharacterized protein n=1 Tax=Vicia faba TaxID=3906 RepID=A0AAV0ZDG6_VICFA|nr:unnamed protein product [Vicia faba]